MKYFKLLNFKKVMLIVLMVGGTAGIGIWCASGVIADKAEQEEMNEYVGRYKRYANHVENAQRCRDNFIETQKLSRLTACQKKYDTAHAAYQSCKKKMPWLDHYDCIMWPDANYEVIDCSEETIIKEIEAQDYFCYAEVKREFDYLTNFETAIVDKFIASLPANQFSLSEDNLVQIYSKFPKEVLTDNMKERIINYTKSKGYTIPMKNPK
jgi:hypothetical protein